MLPCGGRGNFIGPPLKNPISIFYSSWTFSGNFRQIGCNEKCDSLQLHEMQHGSFGVRRLVAAMAPLPRGTRRQVAALHVGLVIVRLLPVSAAEIDSQL